MNIGTQISLLNLFLIVLSIYSEVILLDHKIILYLIFFLRNSHSIFQSGCTILYVYQQCIRILVSSHACHHLFSAFFDSIDPVGHELKNLF